MKAIGTIAVLDANVLYPAPVRDLLLSLADARLFQPKWSKIIQKEWVNNLLKNRPDLVRENIVQTVQAMNIAFPDAEVTRFAEIISDLQLPDPDDRHVLAAAIKAEATHIVTANTKDFPSKYVAAYNLQITHPDYFARDLILIDFDVACLAFEKMIARLRKPPLNRNDVLAILDKCGMTSSVKLLM
ncbi:PIN domain-containing protein [Filimonas effusa]|uniref:PIN domain-containing protein n=1 Tax=Filimonas effusa TaxID=2508721 RepID=A0A4Q1D4G4_9BACT|nr:PIN domain-containing protein [Filimonas effusa]RXK83299.1 PIN domain-containing protein [Filimonas effusa]